MSAKKSDDWGQLKHLGTLTTIPIIFLAGPAVGFFAGGWIDRKYHIYPWVTIFFVGMGFVASVREVMRMVQEVAKSEDA